MDVIDNWLDARPSAITEKSTGELADIGMEINSRAFVLSKVATATLIDKLRPIYDEYSSGRISLYDAQKALREAASGEVGDIARQLAAKARAEFSLRTQRQMAQAVGEYRAMMDPDVRQVYPYLIYHTNRDGFVRPSHKALDGMIFDKNDPFLRSHWPGAWDYNCRCWGEECTAARAAKLGGPVRMAQEVEFDNESGFRFDPGAAFSVNDLTEELTVKTRRQMIADITAALEDNKIKQIGLMVKNTTEPIKPATLPGLKDMRQAMEKAAPAARRSLENAGINPDNIPGRDQQKLAYKNSGAPNLFQPPQDLVDVFDKPITVGAFPAETCEMLGLDKKPIDIVLDVGTENALYGVRHNWQHHKDVFADPSLGEKILKATLGNPRAELVLSLKNKSKGRNIVRMVTVHDPRTGSYCVCRIEGGTCYLMSWHRSPASYGNSHWVFPEFPEKNRRS